METSAGETGSAPRSSALGAGSPWAWLAAIVILSAAVRAVLGLSAPGPWILPDELLYVDLARSIAEGGAPAVRGTTAFGWGVVYPLVVSSAWAVFDDGLVAYRAAVVINAVVMSLAAVPAYLLGHLFLSRRAALLFAAGTVLVPTMALTGSAMTESAAYPLFLLALWATARAIREPTASAQVVVLGAIVAVAATRLPSAVLLPVYVTGVVLYALCIERGERRGYLGRFRPTAVLLACGGAVVLAAAVAQSRGAESAFGGRSGALGAFTLAEAPRNLVLQTGALTLMVAAFPVIATAIVVAAGLSRRAAEKRRLFASVALPTVAGVLALVTFVGSAIDTEGAEGINERYLFVLTPILLVGLGLWLEAPLRRPRLGWIAVAVAAVLVASLPYDRLEPDATFYAPSLVPWVTLPLPRAGIAIVAALCVAAAGAIALRSGGRATRVIVAVTASWLVVVGLVAVAGHRHHARTAARTAGADPTWIDDSVPPGEQVAPVWVQRSEAVDPDADYYPLMVATVLNRSVGRFLRLGGPTYYENVLPTTPVTDADGILVDFAGEPVGARFVLVHCGIGVVGQPVARSADGRLVLVRTDGTVRRSAPGACPR